MRWTRTRAIAAAAVGALLIGVVPGAAAASASQVSPSTVSWNNGASVTVYGKDTTGYKGDVKAGGYVIPDGFISAGQAKMTIKSGSRTLATNVTHKYLAPGTYTTYNTIPYRKVISTAYQDTANATWDFLPGSGQGVSCTVTDSTFSYTDANGTDIYTYTLDCDPTQWIIDTTGDQPIDGTVSTFTYTFDGLNADWSIGDVIDMRTWSDGSTQATSVDISWDYMAGTDAYGPVLKRYVKRTVIVKKLVRKPKSLQVDWDTNHNPYYIDPTAWVNDNYGEQYNKTVKMLLQYNFYGQWKTIQTRYSTSSHDATFHFIYGTAYGGWGAGEYRVYCPLLRTSSAQLWVDAV